MQLLIIKQVHVLPAIWGQEKEGNGDDDNDYRTIVHYSFSLGACPGMEQSRRS